MAILKLSPFDGFVGKNGRVVVYNLNGQVVKRTIGLRKKTKSTAVLASQERIKLLNRLLKPANDFIRIGFGLQSRALGKTAYCLASSANSKAIDGVYPDQFIDYSKVCWSKGNLEPAVIESITEIQTGFSFNWENPKNRGSANASDHVMLMAYFPEKELAIFDVSGQKRSTGTDTLRLPNSRERLLAHTYMAFISADHQEISDSIYTGQYQWGG